MLKNELIEKIDYTLLKPEATWEQIRELCDKAIMHHCASVCIPPCYVSQAAEYVKDKLPICTVIGFPNGNSSYQIKFEEAKQALADGASEIDMVINIGMVKYGDYEYVFNEIKWIKDLCNLREIMFRKPITLKVIIETCLLTEKEKIKMCQIVTDAGADYIKTSTGFSTAGATLEDILLFKKYIGKNVKIKAAGGIRTKEFAEQLVNAGADRLGMSKIDDILTE